MGKIEINTSRNVYLEYELADWKQRAFAFFLDRGVSLISAFLFAALIRTVYRNWMANDWLLVLFIMVFFVTYSLWVEIAMNGQSPGKKAMGLQVVPINGGELSLRHHFIRWSLRLADIYLSGGLIASVLISTGKWQQRLGDLVAHTVVVNKRGGRKFDLKELENLRDAEQYDPNYPEVIELKEDVMLSIKQLVERYDSRPNSYHRRLVSQTAKAIRAKLNITDSVKDDRAFLLHLIRDYVILTR